jgi:hypothetical protein
MSRSLSEKRGWFAHVETSYLTKPSRGPPSFLGGALANAIGWLALHGPALEACFHDSIRPGPLRGSKVMPAGLAALLPRIPGRDSYAIPTQISEVPAGCQPSGDVELDSRRGRPHVDGSLRDRIPRLGETRPRESPPRDTKDYAWIIGSLVRGIPEIPNACQSGCLPAPRGQAEAQKKDLGLVP